MASPDTPKEASRMRNSHWLLVSVLALLGFGVGALLGAPTPVAANTDAQVLAEPTYGDLLVLDDGSFDEEGSPDLISVVDRSGEVAGYVRKSDLFQPPQVHDRRVDSPHMTVFDKTGTEIVGFMVPDHGFVPASKYYRGDFGTPIPTWTIVDAP